MHMHTRPRLFYQPLPHYIHVNSHNSCPPVSSTPLRNHRFTRHRSMRHHAAACRFQPGAALLVLRRRAVRLLAEA